MPVLPPLPSRKWNHEAAAHLLNRAGFGGSAAEIETTRKKGLEATVRELVDGPADGLNLAPPSWAEPRNIREMRMGMRAAKEDDPAQRKEKMREVRMMENEHILDLRRWWLDRMMNGPAPLLEKMALFWHGHFATGVEKVKDAYWMWLQNDTLRRNALGNFTTLTKKISRDPAMMIYLDLQQSRKEHPNENWARELMELFTVGIGNYSEQDIRESARAFTSYRIDMTTQQFRSGPAQQDTGTKNFMGHAGPLVGDDIIDILVQQRACARFIGRKLWRFFVEDEPAPQIVETFAERIRAHGFEMRPILRELFNSEEFFSERGRRTQIKSPVQFILQTCKLLGEPLPPPLAAQNAMRQMGQILFAPPNVKGWEGGKTWISTSTLMFRYNFANYLVNGDKMLPANLPLRGQGKAPGFRQAGAAADQVGREPVEVGKLVPAGLRDKPGELIDFLSQQLFQGPLPEKESKTFAQYLEARQPDTGDDTVRGLLHLMMSTPQFQLT
jgi:uncharacterized protein (DUF1800 family)